MPTSGRSKAFVGYTPPGFLVLTGVMTTWTEAEWMPRGKAHPPAHEPGCRCGCERRTPGRVIVGRDDCPCGCRYRDLAWERSRGLDIYCARCLTHSSDADGWRVPIPAAIVIADRRARAERLKQASFAARKYGGRKSAKRAETG